MLTASALSACASHGSGANDIDGGISGAMQALVNDADGDGISDSADNCPYLPNADQLNTNAIGPGDACELSFVFATGLLSQYARFDSYKELVISLLPLTVSSGPDLMNISAVSPSLAQANVSLLSQRMGVRALLELLPPGSETINGNEALRIEIGTSSVLGGGKASDVWLRLDGTANVSIRMLSGSTVVATQPASNSGVTWKKFSSSNGTLFDRIEIRVTSGAVALRGGGEAVLFALGRANLPCPAGFHRVGETCVDIDECTGLDRICDPLTTCVNTAGSYTCGPCPNGYRGNGTAGCTDVNECTEGTASCSTLVTCSNTEGGYQCGSCPAGYRGNGSSCTDINECAEESDSCDPLVTCTNRPGSYDCGNCPAGYTGGGQTGCADVNECVGPGHACDALVTCTNAPGSYQCGACPSGYRGTGATSCVDIDECSEGSAACSPLVACGNTPGGYQCGTCPNGYAGDGHSCADVDECANGTDQCSELVTCTNTNGGYTCGSCPTGYSGDGATCDDVDECATVPCDSRVTCTNTAGGYSCGACPAGFSGNGYAGCVDINECTAGIDDCNDLVTCSNTLGGFVCGACPSGYAGNGRVCNDVNECADGTAQCDELVSCTNTPGGYTCGACPSGYTGNGTTCTDIDECLAAPCDELTTCNNTVGSYACSVCPAGYAGDGYAGCVDVDECAVENGGCAQTERCVNVPGGRQCISCPTGSTNVETSCGVGACASTGVTSCVLGVVRDSCAPGAPMAADGACDGVDSDCDGQVDEEFTSVATSCGIGPCARTGALSCVDGAAVDSCSPAVPSPSDATCNGLDDDCNGLVDDGFTSQETSCGVGACSAVGTLTCVGGSPQNSCVPAAGGAGDAICNAVDDDCDGAVDEDFVSGPTSCGVGACTRFGTLMCADGALLSSCVPAVATGAPDLCNGVDDDCDGSVDEDFVSTATNCGQGSCAGQGELGCVNGALVNTCLPPVGGACDDGEVCNGSDACNAAGLCVPRAPDSTLCCDGAVLTDPLSLTSYDQTVPTSFIDIAKPIYAGAHASQTAVAGAIDDDHVAVVRGVVLDENAQPLPCAAIRVIGGDQYGVTRTRADGSYEIAVNGGAPVSVRADLTGFTPARRTVTTKWHSYVTAQDIRLFRYAPAQQVSAGATTTTTVEAAVEADWDGSRRSVLLFPAGTHAVVPGESTPRDAFGVRIQELTNRTKVGRDGMPAPLPAQSAFTYAASLQIEGAESQTVTFDRPIAWYVENFLGFPVGGAVPVGSYNETLQQWVAETSGRIVRIVEIGPDGRASLDIDGLAGADDSSTLGVTDAERLALGSRYAAGQSLWRVMIQHFSSWDSNWGWGPPADALPPAVDAPWNDDSPDRGPPCEAIGSIVECDTGNLRERIPVTATPFALVYSSARQEGSSKRTLHIPVTGPVLPESLRRVELHIEIPGVKPKDVSIPAIPNDVYEFSWNGKDRFGNRIQGPLPATITISNVYGADYILTPRFGYNGSGLAISGNVSRHEVNLPKTVTVNINGIDASYAALGGWTLSDHHVYEPISQIVYRGDGTKQNVSSAYATVQTVAGGGALAPTDGVLARDAFLSVYKRGLVVAPDGAFYFADASGGTSYLRKVDGSGVLTTVASFPEPIFGLAMGPDGLLYTSMQFYNCIIQINPKTGAVDSSYACGGAGPYSDFTTITRGYLAFSPTGDLYELTVDSRKLLRIHKGSAPEVLLEDVRYAGFLSGSFAFLPDGAIVIPDGSASILRLDVNGTITTIAGGASNPYTGTVIPDGTPALGCRLQGVGSVTVGPDGLVYASVDPGGAPAIYRVTAQGTMEKVIGGNGRAISDDGTPASRSLTYWPTVLAFGPDGSLYYEDDVIRRVRLPPVLGTASELVVPSEDGTELYTFDTVGRHRWTRDAYSGAKTRQFSYDGGGRLLTITDENGRTTHIARDASGVATGIMSPDGQLTQLQVVSDRLIGLIKANADTYNFGYAPDGSGLLTSMKDPKANSEGLPGYVFEYTAKGKLKRDQAATGASQTLALVEGATKTSLTRTSAEQVSTKYTTDMAGRRVLRTVTHPDQTVSTWRKNLDRSTSYIGPDAVAYDEQLNHNDGSTTFTLNRAHSTYGVVPEYASRALLVLPSGLQRVVTQAEATTLQSANGEIAQQTRITTVNGRAASTVYDGSTRSVTATSPAGRSSETSFDAHGRSIRIQPAGALPIVMAYDASGRLQTATQGDRITSYGYFATGDVTGYLQSVTNPLQQTTRYDRDAIGRILASRAPDDAITLFSWDGLDALTSVTPPSQQPHAQTFDGVGQQLTYMAPTVAGEPNTALGFGYNLDRQLRLRTRMDGTSVGISYRGDGKVNLITTPQGTYGYDYYGTGTCGGCTPGAIKSIMSPSGVVQQFAYDGSLPKSVTWSGAAVAGQIAWSYDADFRIGSESVGPSSITYGYDADGLVKCASPTSCSAPGADALRVTWDPQAARVREITLGAVVESRTYNAYGELATIQASTGTTPLFFESVDSLEHPRDALGRAGVKSETTPTGTVEWTYEYDAVGRLQRTLKDGELYESLVYDGNGNRTQRTTLDGLLDATYDEQDRLRTYGDFTYTYTPDGERKTKTDMVTGEVTTYTYDAFGNLLAVRLPSGDMIEYVHDGLNRRVAKKRNGVVVKRWLYTDRLRIAAEVDAAGNVESRFVYASARNVPDLVVRADRVLRVVADHLGSPRLLVDATSGSAVQSVDFDPWGNVIGQTGGDWLIPFGFAGGHYDTETGLTRFGARDYEASTGRWTARDPVLFNGGDRNLYAYVGNDPLNRTDPAGLWFCNWTGRPLPVGGTAGKGHGHATGKEDEWRVGILPPGACVGGPFGPLDTPSGPLDDVDSADFNGDGVPDRPWSKRDSWPFGEHTPWGDDPERGVCAVDLNPWSKGATPLPLQLQLPVPMY